MLAISDYIARTSPSAARARTRDIAKAVERLAAFPGSGRVVPELGDAVLREIVRPPYRIVYWVEDADVVEILTVFHSSRPLGGLPGDPPPA